LITSDGTFNYQHDADGNTTVRTRISTNYATDYQTTYTWDYRNRLTDVEYYDNNSVLTKDIHYVYDVFDHLLATEVDTTGSGTYNEIEHYVLDVSPEIPAAGVPGTALAQPGLVFDGNRSLIQRNLVALDPAGVDAVPVQGTVISLTQGDTDIFVAHDNLGTPRDDVDTTGTLVNHSVFSVFGQDVYDSNPSIVNWAGFAGGHADPNTGLVNDYHRWYDPATGRWISEDPAGFSANDRNLNRYVRNGAANWLDHTGLTPEPTYTPQNVERLPPVTPPPSPAPFWRLRQWWQSREAIRERRRERIQRLMDIFEWEMELELEGGGIPVPMEIHGSGTIIGSYPF
ncbi:MAG TPA: RHS repeat-associated core domain-containing protein, partial [Pirellulales bacterium]|nr:RHS repeat-associated core domain-containing protein [Pirellulales bacterium]